MADDPNVIEPFNASDEAAVANAARDAKRNEREDLDVLRGVLMDKKGRAWLHRWLTRCHIYSTAFSPGQSDVTAFALGEENVGKRLMVDAMKASPDLYMKMIKEQQDEEVRLNEVRRTERKNRESAEKPEVGMDGIVLPPPAGYPGGPKLPEPDKKDK